MAEARVLLAPGDGIGPEVVSAATKVLNAAAARFGHRLTYVDEDVGGRCIEACGAALRPGAIERARSCAAVLLGAVGDAVHRGGPVRPEQAILELRRGLGLYANLRPVRANAISESASPLRPAIVRDTDILFVRELTGGIYFGQPRERTRTPDGRAAVDTMRYAEGEIRRVAHSAFRLARGRRRKVTSVDKANVLATSALWREVVTEVAREYPGVELEHVLVDACAMHLLARPRSFDVVLTSNLFGDILSDEASMLTGSLGLMPSASLGEALPDTRARWFGLYEPIHGSAPDIAGRGVANPIGTIASAAMLARLSLGWTDVADTIERAIAAALRDGARTADIAEPGRSSLGTDAMADAVVDRLSPDPG